MIGKVFDLFMMFNFLKRLATPFNKWDAFKYGIIDKNGKVLRRRSSLETNKEKASWRYFDTLVANLKKLIGKLPYGKTRIASYAAALLLLKEHNQSGAIDNKLLQETLIKETILLENNFETVYLIENSILSSEIDMLFEEAPTNSVGDGSIIGTETGDPIKKKNKVRDKETREEMLLLTKEWDDINNSFNK